MVRKGEQENANYKNRCKMEINLPGGYCPGQNQLPGASQRRFFGSATHSLLSLDTLKILKTLHFPNLLENCSLNLFGSATTPGWSP